MQNKIHPQYNEIEVTCSCGHKFKTRSTLNSKNLHLDICSSCHPFYTGEQKMVDTAGRIERFRKKYAKNKPAEKAVEKSEPAKKTVKKSEPAEKIAEKSEPAKKTVKKSEPAEKIAEKEVKE